MGTPPQGKQFTILGTGVSLPDKVLTNADLERMVETTAEWITDRTGIQERRIAEPDVSTSVLGAQALRNACDAAGLRPDELDAIIVATSTPDTLFPSTACWVQRRLEVRGMAAFDVNAGCSGWLYALEIASNLLAGGHSKTIGIVGAEVMSKVVDWTDRSTCVLFGDGAGATVIRAAREGDPPAGLLSANWGADGNLAPILYQPAGGTQKPATRATVEGNEHTVHMEGKEVFHRAVRAMASAATRALKSARVTTDEIKLLIPHQANTRIMRATCERSGIPAEKLYSVVHRYGNISAASIPVALHDALTEGRIERGDLVVLTAFGTGLTWGAGVLRY